MELTGFVKKSFILCVLFFMAPALNNSGSKVLWQLSSYQKFTAQTSPKDVRDLIVQLLV